MAEHRRTAAAVVLVLTAGFAAAAFGVAPLTAQPSAPARHTVVERVSGDDVAEQLELLAAQPVRLYRSATTRDSDTADSLLQRLDVNDAQAAAFLRTDARARALLGGAAGAMVRVLTDAHGALTELTGRYAAAPAVGGAPRYTRLTVERVGERLRSRTECLPLLAQPRMGGGTIRSSLFAATDTAGLPQDIGTQLAEVFAGDLDFHHQLRIGDTFSVVYEAWTSEGEAVTWDAGAPSRVLAAQFNAAGQTYSALWYQPQQQSGAYFTFDGQSKRRAYLASPLEFSRVTSGFAMRRHPISNLWTQHKGVDFGAPAGTAVRCVGDGVVAFAGWQNGYGNVVEVRHTATTTTLYAHLSRIDVAAGARVAQGQHLGAVGATGWATGPHLHFEFKVDGAQQDPSFMAKASETATLSAAARVEFSELARGLKGLLSANVPSLPSDTYVE